MEREADFGLTELEKRSRLADGQAASFIKTHSVFCH